MYTLTRILPTRTLVLEQAPALGGSLLVAEVFYKFHSFTLECLAFLATWYIFDAAISRVARRNWPLPSLRRWSNG